MKITINVKPKRTGHINKRSGAGQHDNRPKRLRTRDAVNKNWKMDSE